MKTRKFRAVFTACLLCVCALLTSGAATAEENVVTFAVVDSVGTPGTVRETADKLIDGRDDTKWGVFYNEGDTVSVTLKASEPIVVGGYALTTGSDNRTYKGRNPKDWTLFGSNDYDEEKKTGTWTAVHVVENDTVLPDRNKESFVYSFDNETAYSYYKFEVTANKGDDYMQLSELTFLYGFEGDVAFVGVDGKNTNNKEGYANLFDKKKSRLFFSKWCVSVGDGAYVVARAAKPTVVTGYTFTTGNDTESSPYRNPRSWTLFGSNDYDETAKEGRWTKLHSMENDTVLEGKNFAAYHFDFENSTAYRYYKLVVNESQGDDLIQLCELEFSCSDCEHVFEYLNDPEPKCTEISHTDMVCIKCKKELDVITPALGHSVSEDSLVCSECGKEIFAMADGMYCESMESAAARAKHGGTVTLLQNTEIDGTLNVKKDMTLDLNGYTLSQVGTGSIFEIGGYKTFVLTDTSEGGFGEITGGNAQNGGGVHVNGGSAFIMRGGRISNCTAAGNGGGVAVENGASFTMSGGSIAFCSASGNGGGIYCNGSLALSGTPQVYINTKRTGEESGETTNNIYLNGAQKITIGGGGLSAAETDTGYITPIIGITMRNPSDFTGACDDYGEYFFSDDAEGYRAVYRGGVMRLAKICTVTFDYCCGEDAVLTEKALEGTTVASPTEFFPNEGYRFLGWYKNGEKYDFDEVIADDFTLTARWIKEGETAVELSKNACEVTGFAGNALVVFASYDANGTVIDTKFVPVKEDAVISFAEIGLSTEKAAKVKVFLWDGRIKPLCEGASRNVK